MYDVTPHMRSADLSRTRGTKEKKESQYVVAYRTHVYKIVCSTSRPHIYSEYKGQHLRQTSLQSPHGIYNRVIKKGSIVDCLSTVLFIFSAECNAEFARFYSRYFILLLDILTHDTSTVGDDDVQCSR